MLLKMSYDVDLMNQGYKKQNFEVSNTCDAAAKEFVASKTVFYIEFLD